MGGRSLGRGGGAQEGPSPPPSSSRHNRLRTVAAVTEALPASGLGSHLGAKHSQAPPRAKSRPQVEPRQSDGSAPTKPTGLNPRGRSCSHHSVPVRTGGGGPSRATAGDSAMSPTTSDYGDTRAELGRESKPIEMTAFPFGQRGELRYPLEASLPPRSPHACGQHGSVFR